jgi:5'-methylthioadenosine phosphorylase
MPHIAIIGGSGVGSLDIFEQKSELEIQTPYGQPSDKIQILKFGDLEVAFLPRHGPNHTIPPHLVNYRANIYALKSIGVDTIISLSAVGSLKEEYKPKEIALTDQFIDMTKSRKNTFYENGKVVHISAADPFCQQLRTIASAIPLIAHKKGTYVCIEGPRFSTRAESKLWRVMGADVVGMTLCPEAMLAREQELCYLNIAAVTDYDVWAERPVNNKEVIETMKHNVEKMKDILKVLLPKIPAERTCECRTALKDAGF